MSRRQPRPEPLQRLVRRGDRRCVVAGAWFVLLVVLMVADAVEEDRVFAGTPTRTATVDDGFDPAGDDRRVPVHLDGRVVDTRVVIEGRLPGPGDEVEVELDPRRVDVVRIVGSREPTPADFLLGLVPILVCGVLVVGRRRFVARTLRVAGDDGPAFGLTGRLRTSSWSRHRCALDLYPLDAAADAPPVVSIALASSGGLPLWQRFPVECKGVPRAYALVVARSGDTVLWPSRPAAGGGRGHPRGAGPPATPEELPHSPAPVGAAVRPLHRRVGPWLLLPAIAIAGVIAVVSRQGVLDDRERLASWDQFAAEVVDGSVGDCSARVRFVAGEATNEADVPLGDCSPVPEGDGYDVIVDPDGGEVLLVGSLYDPWTPLLLGCTVVVVALWLALRARTAHREAVATAAGRWVAVAVDAGVPPAGLRSPADPPGTVRGVIEDGSLVAQRSSTLVVAMAGDIGPGGSFLVSLAGVDVLEEHDGAGRVRSRPWARRVGGA